MLLLSGWLTCSKWDWTSCSAFLVPCSNMPEEGQRSSRTFLWVLFLRPFHFFLGYCFWRLPRSNKWRHLPSSGFPTTLFFDVQHSFLISEIKERTMVLIRLLFTAFAHMSLVSFMSPCLFHVPQNSSLEHSFRTCSTWVQIMALPSSIWALWPQTSCITTDV